MDTAILRKARGAFFTPAELTTFIARWAIRSADDVILEPSCGEAAFLVAAAERLTYLGWGPSVPPGHLHGVEIHSESAVSASRLLSRSGISADIAVSDFFDLPAESRFDAVIGNPPYVRFQQFSGNSRAKGLRAALAQGVRLSGLASSWAAFTVHAAQFLKPNGRLGLVLPAELLSVGYARQVRSFLLSRFAKVRLILFERRIFPDVSEEVVLLLAEGDGPSDHFEVYQARDASQLGSINLQAWVGYTPTGNEKWTPALLPRDALTVYERNVRAPGFETLSDWGETYLGTVTGNNSFFTLTAADVRRLGLLSTEVLKISPPGSKHLRGRIFSTRAWEALRNEGKSCFLFAPSQEPSAAAREYIASGESAGIHTSYKCRTRAPWWRVPRVRRPDLLFTYMNHDTPKLITNDAAVFPLNSLYGVLLKEQRQRKGRSLLPVSCLNSLTLLGAEVVGRSYGGGLLKHEPREADLLPVPSLVAISAIETELDALLPQIVTKMRGNDQTSAVELVDRIILEAHFGFSTEEVRQLRLARDHLRQRRISRSKQPDK